MDASASLQRKVLWRLIAPLTFLIFLSSLDRSNIAVAALQMNRELGLTPEMYGRGAGLFFFLGYIALQYPHTALLRRIGPRRWVAGTVMIWGCIAAATALVASPPQFYGVRFLLGVAEGGFAPGATYLAASWALRRRRAAAVSATMLAIPLSQVFGAPLSGWLMTVPTAGVSGWRLMIGLEGLATVAFGLIAWFVFVDRLADARWLSPQEKAVASDMAAPEPGPAQGGERGFLMDPRFWAAAALWFCLLAGAQGLLFWMAQVVKHVAGGDPLQVGLVTALPWLGVGAGMCVGAWSSDRTGERHLHLTGAAFLAGGALLAAYLIPPGPTALVLLLFGGLGLGAAQAAFWPIPIGRLSPAHAGAGITVINMAGNCAGLVMTPLIGLLRQRAGNFDVAMYVMVAVVALAGVLALALRVIGGGGGEPGGRPAPAPSSPRVRPF